MNLDLYDLCSTELKAKLKPAREQFVAYGDWETEAAADVRCRIPSAEVALLHG